MMSVWTFPLSGLSTILSYTKCFVILFCFFFNGRVTVVGTSAPGIGKVFAEMVDEVAGDDASTKKDDNKKAEEEDTPPYSHPSLYSWVAMAVYWSAVGIRLDGYDLMTL